MRSVSTRTAGLLILALGLWGGLIPFVGHYFHFALGPDKSWAWTSGRLYLDVLPAAAAVLGGLMLIVSGPHPSSRLGALLAIAAGIWFAIGPDVSHLWNAAGAQGAAHGSTTTRVLEMLAYHTALGGLLAALGGYALPRLVLARDVVAEPAEAGRPRRLAGPRRTGDAALAGGAVAAEREPATTAMPAAERGEPVAAAPAATEPHNELAAETTARPTREYAGGPASADRAEAANAPAADHDAEEAVPPSAGHEPEPADDRADEPAGAAPPPGPSGTTAAAPTPDPSGTTAADGSGQYADTMPGAGGADGDATRPHTIRRRRGGLLSGLFARR